MSSMKEKFSSLKNKGNRNIDDILDDIEPPGTDPFLESGQDDVVSIGIAPEKKQATKYEIWVVKSYKD